MTLPPCVGNTRARNRAVTGAMLKVPLLSDRSVLNYISSGNELVPLNLTPYEVVTIN